MEALDRAGVVYAVEEPAAPDVAGAAGTTVVLTGVETDRRWLGELARETAPAHRLVVPEPLRFLYLARSRVGQRWYVTSIDGEIEPATFGDGLYAVEQLVVGAGEQWSRRPLLVGDGQGGVLALALALLVPERIAGVVALDAALPEIPGWERPAADACALPVTLLPGDDLPAVEVERTRATLAAAGAAVTVGQPPPSGVGLAAWWRDAAAAGATAF